MTLEITKKKVSSESDEIELGKLIGELIDHRKLIIAVTSIFGLIALVYAIFATPIYQANVLIQVEQKQGNAILSSLSQMLPDSQPQSAPEIALLQSRMILGKTVDDLNLQIDIKPDYFPIIGDGLARLMKKDPGQLLISKLRPKDNSYSNYQPILLTVIDSNHFKIENASVETNGVVGQQISVGDFDIVVGAITANPGQKFAITYYSHLEAINRLQNALKVSDQGKDTGMLSLLMTGDNPRLITEILDNISKNYLTQNVARQAAQDEKSLEFLNQQLPKVRSDLDKAEDKLNEYRKQKDSVDLSMEAKSVLDQIVNVDNQLNSLTFREAEISQLYTREHPTYKALMEKQHTLQEEKSRLNKKVSAMPSTQQAVLRLSRDVESGRAVYLQLLNRQQELSIAKSSAIGNVRIIDNAVVDPHPVKPKKVLIIIVGFILGLLISTVTVLLRVYLRRGIESAEQLEEYGINVYASIPVSEWLSSQLSKKRKVRENESDTLLSVENPTDLAVEAIRGLRTSLHFAMMESKNNILMISGASPNAGKTFVSTNLAATIAQTGKKVLFIDADLRKGYVHKMFGHVSGRGLSDILSGKEPINNVIQRVDSAGFDYVPRGQVPPNPAELLMHPRFEDFLQWASRNYELVIVDTPPILAVTDAAIIGRYVGTSLLVARFEVNTPKEIDVSIKRFEQSGVVIKGCILNGVIKKASSYYSYGYHQYGYSYSDNKKD